MLEGLDRMVEYLSSVVRNRHDMATNRQINVIALGSPAYHTALLLARRLRSNGMSVQVTNDGQPARLARLTYGGDRVGIDPKYCCLSSTTLRFMRAATSKYTRVQGHSNVRVLSTIMSNTGKKSISTALAQSISDLSERTAHLANSLSQIDANGRTNAFVLHRNVVMLRNAMAKHVATMNAFMSVLAADTAVRATLLNRIVTSAQPSVNHKAATQSVVDAGMQRPAPMPALTAYSFASTLAPSSLQALVSGSG
jgi:hypothetical protein